MKTKIVIAASLACVAVAGLLYASPYLALHRIAQAVERKDAEAVSAHVDFPALRESIKAQMQAKVQAQLPQSGAPNDPFSSLGQALAMGVVHQVTEALVSPAGVMLMLERGKPGKPSDVAAAGLGVNTQGNAQRKNYAVRYQNWSTVFVHSEGESGGFVFQRDGLIGWKLVAIQMD